MAVVLYNTPIYLILILISDDNGTTEFGETKPRETTPRALANALVFTNGSTL